MSDYEGSLYELDHGLDNAHQNAEERRHACHTHLATEVSAAE